ncbi:hypothetical protein HJ01_01660 [Flavobacterium frigoris PS1]|uniref:Uncharacterized protein n=1 Tax=Flavobacterium frigoris (strain PS1) TaxID=1086011 RepID=H7FRB1_FLAFP|nr:hypothetical protein HJ01_01660 [Flavobacterium frigoris PS1]
MPKHNLKYKGNKQHRCRKTKFKYKPKLLIPTKKNTLYIIYRIELLLL